ncbi:MAG: hypothetical protein ACK5CA_17720, partial [Cyanobacteriota bacterium]
MTDRDHPGHQDRDLVKVVTHLNFRNSENRLGTELSDLVSRRAQLVEMLNSEERRRHSVRNSRAKTDIENHIEWLKARLKELEQEIDQLRKKREEWNQQYTLLTSVPGVGRVTALVLLSMLPELGELPVKKLASLVGIA